jgi:hypothetical protein
MLKNLVLLSLLVLTGSFAFAQSDEPTLLCRFEPIGRPLTFVKYYADSRTAWVQSGYPAKWVEYTDVVEVKGLPPFGKKGTSLVAFGGDVPILHYSRTNAGKIWYELREKNYPFSAVWGSLPGTKARQEGVCWTPSLQAEVIPYD